MPQLELTGHAVSQQLRAELVVARRLSDDRGVELRFQSNEREGNVFVFSALFAGQLAMLPKMDSHQQFLYLLHM